MSRLPLREAVDVGFVLVLSRRSQPGRALARLGELIDGMGSARVATVLVDRGAVRNRILRRLAPSSWSGREPFDLELEIAAAGLRRLHRRYVPNLLVVATDALLDREDRDLACLDRYALDFARDTGRTLVFWKSVLSVRLARALARWKRPDLARDVVVVPIAGVRERILSAGELRALWNEPDPADCLDLRTIRRLGQAGLEPRRLSAGLVASLAGPAELAPARVEPVELRASVDSAAFPETIRHGELLPVRVVGWVSSSPPVREVEVRAGLSSVTVPVAVHRPDVVAAFGGVREEVCGYDVAADLGPFPPGSYAVTLVAAAAGVRQTLGAFRVSERLEVTELAVLAPEASLADGSTPLAIRGRVLASGAARIELRVGDEPVEAPAIARTPGERPGEPERFDFRAAVTLAGEVDGICVEARASDDGGRSAQRRAPVHVAAGTGPALRWRERRIGAFDPARGGTPVTLEGLLFAARPGDRLELRREGSPVAAPALVPWEGGLGETRPATFALCGEIAGAPAGEATFELALVRSDGVEILDRWSATVPEVEAGLEVSTVDATPAGAGEARLIVEGRLRGATGVDALLLYVDGTLRARLGAEWLEPASAFEGVAADHHFFRFDSAIPLAAGEHRLEVRTRRGLTERSAARRELRFEPGAAGSEVRLLSADLDRLVRARVTPVWARLAIAGSVVGGRAGDTVELHLDGSPAGRSPVAADGGFELIAHPRESGVGAGELSVWRGATRLLVSPAFHVAPRPLRVPAAAVAQLEAVLARLLPEPARRALPAEETLRALFEAEPGAIGAFRRTLARLDRDTGEAERRPGEVLVEPPPAEVRPLRVLFAAWEPPCSLHGGGVAIRNTLRSLGSRHEITLIHTAAPGEEGLSEEVRPWVRELIAVRREWRPPNLDPGIGVPPAFAWSYSPGYREAIEGEMATGRYDLFNGDFLRTALHSNVADGPSIGVTHEVESFAAAMTVPEPFDSADAAAGWLGRFLRSLHFEAIFAPERFSDYVTVTEPEARFLARLLPGRRLFVSPIPIDVEALGEAARLRSPAPTPLFLFFGNFVHPPNREAARLLAEEIAPRVEARRPGCRFVIAGSNPPASLVAREGLHGVHVPGFVPDLSELTATCTAVLAPIFQGAGMRVKLLEAMAAGCPVVSTSLGFSGIEGEAGRDWLCADSVDAFVDVALRLAAEPALGETLGRAGRELTARVYGIEVQGERRERIWMAARRAFDTDRGLS